MSLIDNIFRNASQKQAKILLPEANDIRILEAASKASQMNIAKIFLLGEEENILQVANENSIDISHCEIIELENKKLDEFIELYYNLRKHKGMTEEQAKEDIKLPMNLASTMLKAGVVDGIVAGAQYSSAEVLRSALKIVGMAEGNNLVSSFFIMNIPNTTYGHEGIFAFADCAMIENPNAQQLSEIAINTAKSFEELLSIEPQVAMLSYSTKGSAKSENIEKVIEATKLVQEKAADLRVDGELQVDAAIDKTVAERKIPNSRLAGKANVLIFPDLNSGNIAYKLVQRLAKADAFGPITQGLYKPVNDLSRGCTVEDILGVIAITAVQTK